MIRVSSTLYFIQNSGPFLDLGPPKRKRRDNVFCSTKSNGKKNLLRVYRSLSIAVSKMHSFFLLDHPLLENGMNNDDCLSIIDKPNV